ncbi:MAG: hypothetical protein AAGJ79_08980 [Verrucomicrobiota bacterium]
MIELTDEQMAKVREWVGAGADLNAIQDSLREEFDIRMSFMDTRFLISDLNLEIQEAEEEKEPEASKNEDGAEEMTGAEDFPDSTDDFPETPTDEPGGFGSSVNVTMDTVGRPGMIASGQVTFSDGKKAAWYFDQMGRLGIDPEEVEYRPSEEDLLAFQDELQRVAAEAGI